MLALPVCRWRGESRGGRCICRSAKFVNAPNIVAEDFCRECCYVDHDTPAPLPRHLPCVHLGKETGAMLDCPSCTGRVQLKLFACTLHGKCLPVRFGDELREAPSCSLCVDYLPRDPLGRNSAEMLGLAESFLTALPTYPEDRYQGRGIVIAGGGERYFASLYVAIRALRHVGCQLPIQVWYLGRNDEMPPDKQALLAPWQVECVDADEVRRRCPARQLNGWELKVFATLHSPFEEVVFLDADCYPCRDPEFLLDRDDYRDCGAIFWPDMVPIDTRLKWPAFGVSDPQRQGSVESGQFVLNKRLGWRPLNLAWFYNDHSDYYYRYCYGDKHTFEVAWTRCGQPFLMWQPQARWQDVAYIHPGPDGLPLFVHRCADKFRFDRQDFVTVQHHRSSKFYPDLPLERECWSWMAELSQVLGRPLQLPVP